MSSETIIFRNMEASDLVDVLDIQGETEISSWSKSDYLKEIRKDDSIAIVALDDSENLIGFIVVRLIINHTYIGNIDEMFFNSSELFLIAVRKKYQQKDIGKKLLLNTFELLKESKVSEIWLEVRETNARAIKFYEKNGFVKKYKRKNYYSNPLEDALVLMSKI